jgi:hypothetical protein
MALPTRRGARGAGVVRRGPLRRRRVPRRGARRSAARCGPRRRTGRLSRRLSRRRPAGLLHRPSRFRPPLAPAGERHEDRAAALGRATPTGVLVFDVGAGVLLPLVRIVVEQLRALRDRFTGIDEHTATLDHGVAVRRTRVVDITRVIAANGGVDHGARRDREEEGVVARHGIIVIPAVTLGPRDPLADVLADALPLLDPSSGEPPATLDPGTAYLK